MSNNFLVLKSLKSGLDDDESLVVVRGNISYLRIVGKEPRWSLMTATASEDHGRIRLCNDTKKLIEAAERLGAALGVDPVQKHDRAGRPYILVCEIERKAGESHDEFNRLNTQAFTKFFEFFDELCRSEASSNEMRELHGHLAEGDEPVYLNDGVWLASDGSLRG